jgi:hypothetical protein
VNDLCDSFLLPHFQIRIQFKNTPTALFPNSVRDELVIRVQPSEAVYMKVMNKIPGLSGDLVRIMRQIEFLFLFLFTFLSFLMNVLFVLSVLCLLLDCQ